MLLVVAVISVAAGAAGPAFLPAADASSLVGAVAAAPGAAAVQLSAQGGSAVLRQMTALAADPPGGRKGWYAPPQLQGSAGVTMAGVGELYGGSLLARTGLCAHIRLLRGACPRTEGDVALSARSASALGKGVGSALTVAVPGSSAPIRLSVVGVYALPALDPGGYWSSLALFDFGQPQGRTQVDALLTPMSTVLATAGSGDIPALTATLPAVPRSLRGGPIRALGRGVAAFAAAAGRAGISSSSGVSALLAQVSRSDRAVATVVALASVQLVCLGLLVMYLVVAASAAERHGEVELALRRGLTRPQLLAVAVGEPALVIGAALPLGLVVGWAAVRGAAPRLFVAGVAVGLPALAVLTAAGICVAGLAAIAAATGELWRGSPMERGRGRAARAATDATAVALAVAGIASLSARGSLGAAGSDPVAVLGPALLAVGAGVVGLRVVEGLARLAVRATSGSSSVATFLALRSVARRRPEPLRRALALAAAVVLAVFGVETWAVAATNRAVVASVQVGAQRVVDVTTPPGASLAAVVDRADPAGRTAMAAEVYRSTSGTTLAVQADRLAAVAAWPRRLADRSVRDIARYLAPRTFPPLTFAGGGLVARVSEPAGQLPITLTATVFNLAGQNTDTLSFPTIRPGTRTYTAPAVGFCASVCRLVGLSPTAADPNATVTAPVVSLTIRSLRPARTAGVPDPPVSLTAPGSWTAQPAGVTVAPSPAGLHVSVPGQDIVSQGVSFAPADIPPTIPVVATSEALAVGAVNPGSDAFTALGLDGNPLPVAGGVQASTLPEVGTPAVMVDLSLARRAQTAASAAVAQVWLRGPHQGRVLRRLSGLGVHVVGGQTAAGARAELGRSALAVAYAFVLASAAAAAVLAAGATLYSFLAATRRRRSGLHALLVAGVPARRLRRAVAFETGAVLGVALVVGGAVGYAACLLALPSMPQLAGGSAGVPVDRSVAALPLVAVLGALAAAFGVMVAVTVRGLVGRQGTSPPEAAA